MSNMKSSMKSRISNVARRSVVIVRDKEDRNAYCSGCILIKDSTAAVTVVAPSEFVYGRDKRLKVVFFDKKELDATFVDVQGPFCFLRTTFHSSCGVISLIEDGHDLGPQSTFMFVPLSSTTNQRMPTYATVESLESYSNDVTVQTVDSTNYFMVTCAFFGKTLSGINRLGAAPVFTASGKTAGIVLKDCRLETPGSEMKVVLKSKHVRELMLLIPPVPPMDPGKKRKRW